MMMETYIRISPYGGPREMKALIAVCAWAEGLPPERVKIDRSRTQFLVQDAADVAAIEAILRQHDAHPEQRLARKGEGNYAACLRAASEGDRKAFE